MNTKEQIYKTKWHYRLYKVVFGLFLILSISTLTYCFIEYGLSNSTDVWPAPIILNFIIWGLYRAFVYVKYDE